MRFTDILEAYNEYYKLFYQRGQIPIKITGKGFWGVSSSEDVHELFSQLKIQGKFLDLGSGDGKVVAVASLFCKECTGIECDRELVDASNGMKAKLGFKGRFLQQDYMLHDLSQYDYLFIHPDNDLELLENKLIEELKGKVIVLSSTHQFTRLKKLKELDISGFKAIVYGRH